MKEQNEETETVITEELEVTNIKREDRYKEEENVGLSEMENRAIEAASNSPAAFEHEMIIAHKRGLLPKWVSKPQYAVMAGQVCLELGLKPLTGMGLLYISQSEQITLTGRGLTTLVEMAGYQVITLRDNQPVWMTVNPTYYYLEGEFYKENPNDKPIRLTDACTTIELRHPTKIPRDTRCITNWTIEEAAQAQLLGRKGGTWEKYQGDLLWIRCLSRAARRYCAKAIAGLYTTEELDELGNIRYDASGNLILPNTRI